METEALLSSLNDALLAFSCPRFFETERGFQGQLLIELDKRIKLKPQVIVEQEYQKSSKLHGLTIRPDIIIHEPFVPLRHSCRNIGNAAVIELKMKANIADAIADFQSLESMINVLRYPVGIFVNINSNETHSNLVPDSIKGRVVCFTISLLDGKACVLKSISNRSCDK